MNCYVCDEELIWGGDHDTDDGDGIVTNLSCSECNSYVIVYWNNQEQKDDQ